MTDVPYVTYMALYVLSLQIIQSNSGTSTVWKLNSEEGKIVEGKGFGSIFVEPEVTDDPIFNIITSTIHYGKTWVKKSETFPENCQITCTEIKRSSNYNTGATSNLKNSTRGAIKVRGKNSEDEEVLDCGKSANFTFYDNLIGVANRQNHPLVPEPDVAFLFKKRSAKNAELDVDALEKKLKKAKREKPKSVQLYNQIGNFWRIKGDAFKSIECFRRALAVNPHNADVLLNLARVLLNLQYLDDAIYLARRSLEVQPPDKNAWQQYYTLGEIFRAYGHYQEASLHLRHSLELKPEFQPAIAALKDMETVPETSVHVYTLLIIVCLVLGVLLVILSSVDGNLDSEFGEIKTHRHFNRAMAMRSLKMGITGRTRTKRST